MINEILESLAHNSIITTLSLSIMLDTFLGVLRAIKERKFNSTIGINGAIRKIAMLVCVGFLMCIDCIIHVDLLFMVPNEYIEIFGFQELGLSEFFASMFILYESVSILKNMLFCNLPVPKIIKEKIEKFLESFTTEINNKE